jgi:DNA-binding NarL/FixJ family response regulator
MQTSQGVVPVEVHSVALNAGGRVVGVFGISSPGEAPRQPPTGLRHPHLTARQLEVLQHLAAGETTTQIAEALGVAPDTVRNHVRAIFRALQTHSRLEAVIEAQRLGLLE